MFARRLLPSVSWQKSCNLQGGSALLRYFSSSSISRAKGDGIMVVGSDSLNNSSFTTTTSTTTTTTTTTTNETNASTSTSVELSETALNDIQAFYAHHYTRKEIVPTLADFVSNYRRAYGGKTLSKEIQQKLRDSLKFEDKAQSKQAKYRTQSNMQAALEALFKKTKKPPTKSEKKRKDAKTKERAVLASKKRSGHKKTEKATKGEQNRKKKKKAKAIAAQTSRSSASTTTITSTTTTTTTSATSSSAFRSAMTRYLQQLTPKEKKKKSKRTTKRSSPSSSQVAGANEVAVGQRLESSSSTAVSSSAYRQDHHQELKIAATGKGSSSNQKGGTLSFSLERGANIEATGGASVTRVAGNTEKGRLYQELQATAQRLNDGGRNGEVRITVQ